MREDEEHYTVPIASKMDSCQYGCGERFKELNQLWDHEQECELADEYKRAIGPKARPRTWEQKKMSSLCSARDEDKDGSGCDEARD